MGILDLVFPKKCLKCGESGKYICRKCLKKVSYAKQLCPACNKPSIDGVSHTKCKTAWGLDGVSCIWDYGGVIRKAILILKYKYSSDVAKELACLLDEEIKKGKIVLPKNVVLVPIPLHKKRKNWRGFNQTEEIGKLLVKSQHWSYCPDLITRKGLRKPQTELKGKQRRKNVVGVFSLNRAFEKLLKQKTILIFDDVYTTGSTLKEAGKVLKRNGAKKVWGLTIAS